MANYQITKSFSFQGGPQIGYLLSAKTEADVSLGSFSGNGKDDAKDQMKAFDLGLAFGAEYEFANGFFISARYVFGLTNSLKSVTTISVDVVEEDPDFMSTSYQPKIHNNVGQISVGYMF